MVTKYLHNNQNLKFRLLHINQITSEKTVNIDCYMEFKVDIYMISSNPIALNQTEKVISLIEYLSTGHVIVKLGSIANYYQYNSLIWTEIFQVMQCLQKIHHDSKCEGG